MPPQEGGHRNGPGFLQAVHRGLPRGRGARLQRREIYFSNQKLDEAITYFELATRIKPGWSEGYYKLGLAYLNKADYEKARQSLTKVLELEPEGERAAAVKGILDTIDKIKK